MAKKSVIVKEYRKKQLVAKHFDKRIELKKIISNVAINQADKIIAVNKLQKLPRNSCPARVRNRCKITGRPHGYYRKFGLCRNKLREYSMLGMVPGIVKASW